MLLDLAEEIVASVLRQKAKWMPPTLTRDDLRQEAWVALLEAQEAGIIDPDDLKRAARTHIDNVIRREGRRRDVPGRTAGPGLFDTT